MRNDAGRETGPVPALLFFRPRGVWWAASAASVTSLRTGRTTATLVVGIEPVGVAVSPDGARVYVADGLSDDVPAVDARTLRVGGAVKVGRRPWGVAVGR